MQIKTSGKGIYLHFPHRKLFIFLIIIFITLVFAGTALYRYYLANYYDSSANGSEIKEIQQNTIPADVKEAIQHGEKFTTITFRDITPSKIPVIPTIIVTPIPTLTPIQTYTPLSKIQVPILMYHYIEYVQDKNDKTRNSLNTTPYTLEQEIKTLSDAGYTFITMAELSEIMDGKATLPIKPIVLTFDDGYRDFYIDAYPILKKYHVKATEYVIAGFLDRPNHLTTSQLQEIANDGLVEIGAHTVHHRWLKGLPLKEVTVEVFQSKEILQQLIHKPVVSFAYPFGAFDLQAIQVVSDAGFKTSTSTIPGIEQTQDNRFFLYRLRPSGRIGIYLLNWLAQRKFN